MHKILTNPAPTFLAQFSSFSCSLGNIWPNNRFMPSPFGVGTPCEIPGSATGNGNSFDTPVYKVKFFQ